MAEPARDPEVERRIREHVEAIDSALATKGVPPAERRSVTGDVEIQIRDMLATTAGGAPTLADVEAVLRKLDAPESYAEDAETTPFEKEALTPRAEPEFRAFRTKQRTGELDMTGATASHGTKRTSGLAIASLIFSCLTVVLGPLGCIPGIICGHIARRQCRKDPNLAGDGLASAGLIVGYILLALSVMVVLLFLSLRPSPSVPTP